MSTPTRFPHGVVNAARESNLGSLLGLDPTKMAETFVDFTGMDYIAASWTVTETQAAATQGMVAVNASGEFGLLALVNSAGATDVNSIQLTTASIFLGDKSKRWWLKGRVSRDNADVGMGFGVQAVNTTPFTVANGLFIHILGAATAAVFTIAKTTTKTASVAAAYPTSALNTFVTLGMAYNGRDRIDCFVNDVKRAEITDLTLLPDTVALLPTVSQLNTSTNARNVHCDYLYFAAER